MHGMTLGKEVLGMGIRAQHDSTCFDRALTRLDIPFTLFGAQ